MLLVAVIILSSLLVRCVSSIANKEPEPLVLSSITAQTVSHVQSCILPENEIVKRFEAQGVEETWAKKAAALAQTDRRFMLMAQHSDELGREGSEVTNKMVKLAVEDPEAINYVVDFIDKYPQEEAQPYTEAVTKGVVPHLYQWDERWAYITYSSTTFGCTGCGPTSMSMVYMGVTGKNDLSPADMAERAANDGYETDYEGTMNQYFVNEAPDLGMDVIELDINSDSLTWALESGMPVICNVGPGDFTLYGHFFVITGLNDDGSLSINDPFSSVRSSETWDMDLVLNQTVALYAYSLAGTSSTDGDSSSDSDSSSKSDSDASDNTLTV